MNILVETSFQCRRNHNIKYIVVEKIVSSNIRSRCHRFVNWLCYLNFFDPMYCKMKICCLWTYFSFEVDFPVFNFIVSKNFPRRNSDIGNLVSSIISLSEKNPSVILRILSPLWKLDTESDEFCGSRLISLSSRFVVPGLWSLNSWEEDVKFFELWKRVEVRPSRADSRSKNVFLCVRNIPCIER